MNKEGYYNRIEKINNKVLTDRVSKDEEISLICQKNYLRGCYIDYLEKENKKYKEVIDKAVEFLYKIKFDKTDKYICISEYIEYQQLLDILKEVSE